MNEMLNEISREYKKISEMFYGVSHDFPLGTIPENNGKPHIEISKDGKIAYVGTDRGVETMRKETYSVDELMYWIFSSYVNSRAFRNGTGRNFIEAQKLALDDIGRISTVWRDKMQKGTNQRVHPLSHLRQYGAKALRRSTPNNWVFIR